MLFTLLACTSSVLTSPVTNDPFGDDCDEKNANDKCMPLESLSFDVQGVCVDVAVSFCVFDVSRVMMADPNRVCCYRKR